MTESEARKILINKSLTGAFTNEEYDALNVLFSEVEQLQGARNKAIDEFVKVLLNQKVVDKSIIKRIAEQMKINNRKGN